MKKIIFIAIFFCLSKGLWAQVSNPYSTELNKFVGTWVYKKNGSEIKFVLKKVLVSVPNEEKKLEILGGSHYYKKDNNFIENALGKNDTSLTNGYFMERKNFNKIKIEFFDSTKQKSCDMIMVYLPGDGGKLKITLINQEGVRLIKPGKPKFDGDFTLPATMILSKEQ